MAEMDRQNFKVEHVMTGMPQLKCLQCIGEAQVDKSDAAHEIRDAITLAPMWVTQAAGMNMVMACVAVPTCLEHIQTAEKTPQQRAMEGGIILGQQGMS